MIISCPKYKTFARVVLSTFQHTRLVSLTGCLNDGETEEYRQRLYGELTRAIGQATAEEKIVIVFCFSKVDLLQLFLEGLKGLLLPRQTLTIIVKGCHPDTPLRLRDPSRIRRGRIIHRFGIIHRIAVLTVHSLHPSVGRTRERSIIRPVIGKIKSVHL